MSNLKILYIIAFATCILPNTPNVKNVSYDEPQVDLMIYQNHIEELEEGSCSLTKDEPKTITIEELLRQKEKSEEAYDYDSGDIGDY